MSIIRYILIGILVFIIIRLFVRHNADATQNNNQKNTGDKIKFGGKKISKSIGEYVDYEEVGGKK